VERGVEFIQEAHDLRRTGPREGPRRTILRLLAEHAYSHKPGGFRLASGATSDEYLDCKQALSLPESLLATGAVFLELLDPRTVAVGGLTMGADPIAIATALRSAGTDRPVRWFSVRKDRKARSQSPYRGRGARSQLGLFDRPVDPTKSRRPMEQLSLSPEQP
jgi:hypothetical protein